MLDICAKYVTEENAEELVDRLVECVKRGVGMPTRVGYEKIKRARGGGGRGRGGGETFFCFVFCLLFMLRGKYIT